MTFKLVTTSATPTLLSLGSICNITVFNSDLANSAIISSNSIGTPDIGIIPPNSTLTLDMNRFTIEQIYYVDYIAGAHSNIYIWAW